MYIVERLNQDLGWEVYHSQGLRMEVIQWFPGVKLESSLGMKTSKTDELSQNILQ